MTKSWFLKSFASSLSASPLPPQEPKHCSDAEKNTAMVDSKRSASSNDASRTPSTKPSNKTTTNNYNSPLDRRASAGSVSRW